MQFLNSPTQLSAVNRKQKLVMSGFQSMLFSQISYRSTLRRGAMIENVPQTPQTIGLIDKKVCEIGQNSIVSYRTTARGYR